MRRALVFAVVLAAVAASSANARVTLAPQGCRAGVQRPTQITFACADGGFYVHRLRWSQWGGRVAYGRGEVVSNTCDPSCVAGNFITARVRVHLYNRRRCPGRSHLYYRRATFIHAGGRASAYTIPCPY